MQTVQYPNDRRKAVRIDFATDVTILNGEGRIIARGLMSNISVAGVLVSTNVPEGKVGDTYQMQIIFPGRNSKLIIDGLSCILSRSGTYETAFSFENPLEWSLLFHVYRKRVMELNEED